MHELLVCHAEFSDLSGLCVCKADELSIRNGVKNYVESTQFIPRWLKREQRKKLCIVPGCSLASERCCHFASYEDICIACGVSGHLNADSDSANMCGEH
jgi:hypothetical protein